MEIEMDLHSRKSRRKSLGINQKLRIIEQNGSPIYLYEEPAFALLDTRGEQIPNASYVPDSQMSAETINVYRQAYEGAKNNHQKNKVLRRFFGITPHLAFQPGTWSWFIWHNAIAAGKNDKGSQLILKEIARAISTVTFYENRTETTTLIAAKTVLRELMTDLELLEMNNNWREGWDLHKKGLWTDKRLKECANKYFYPMVDRLCKLNPSRIGVEEKKLLIQKLKGGLRKAAEYTISLAFGVSERALQSKEPPAFPNRKI
jgi:hypothetical protein